MLFDNKHLTIQKGDKKYGYYCLSDINIRDTKIDYISAVLLANTFILLRVCRFGCGRTSLE